MRSSITSPQPGNAIYELDAIHIEADQLPLLRKTWSTFGCRTANLGVLEHYFLSRSALPFTPVKLTQTIGFTLNQIEFHIVQIAAILIHSDFLGDKIALACSSRHAKVSDTTHFRACKRLKKQFLP